MLTDLLEVLRIHPFYMSPPAPSYVVYSGDSRGRFLPPYSYSAQDLIYPVYYAGPQ